jgi:serine/threonine-protein kinase HipA
MCIRDSAGTSQGGFRPKAAVIDEDGSLWIAKFPAETDRYDVETCEAAALHVARDAGLNVPDFRHIRVDPDRAVLLVKRFDRTASGRLGYQSMRTAIRLGVDETTDYLTMANAAGHLAGSSGRRAIVAAAVLNLTVHNIDDHARNFGFLQDAQGRWTPSPIFDVTPYNQEQDGTPFSEGEPRRSREQLLDLDWGLPRREVEAIAAKVGAAAERVYSVAAQAYGLDPESAARAETVRARAQRPS